MVGRRTLNPLILVQTQARQHMKLNIVDAIRAIDGHPDYDLCTDKTELEGKHGICVYYESSFIGKLYFKTPTSEFPVVDLPQPHIDRLVRYLVNEKGYDPECLV